MKEDDLIINDEPPFIPDCYYARWEIIELYCGWNPLKQDDELDNTPPTSIQQTAPPKPIELSKADQKKRDADIKKVKAYVARLTTYKVPEVSDEKCSEILGTIVKWLGGAEDRVNQIFPEKQDA